MSPFEPGDAKVLEVFDVHHSAQDIPEWTPMEEELEGEEDQDEPRYFDLEDGHDEQENAQEGYDEDDEPEEAVEDEEPKLSTKATTEIEVRQEKTEAMRHERASLLLESIADDEDLEHYFERIPEQVAEDRSAMTEKLKQLLSEQAGLQRKNRLLEIWTLKHMKKADRKMAPSDMTKRQDESERHYRVFLARYSLQVDKLVQIEIQTRAELEDYELKATRAREKDQVTFDELVERQKSVGVGLVFAASGRKLSEKAVVEMIRRQTSRRNLLVRNRISYILQRHQLEEMHAQLRSLETLGEGMTTMDYEELKVRLMANKQKLDERDHDLEKLRYKFDQLVHTIAHMREKEVALTWDIVDEETVLDRYRQIVEKSREEVGCLHRSLAKVRQLHLEKRNEAGFLVTLPVLWEMERTMKELDALKSDVQRVQEEVERYSLKETRGKTSQRTAAMIPTPRKFKTSFFLTGR